MEQTIEMSITKSSRKRRLVAFLIDHIVLTFSAVLILFSILGPDLIDNSDFGQIKVIMFSVMLPFFFVYFCKDFVNGISLGRWIMGIMVRDENIPTEVPSKGRLFIRNLFLVIWPIEFLVLALSGDKKRIGDNFGKTNVFKNPDKAKKSYRIITLVVIGLAIFGLTSLFAGITLKSSEAYKAAVHFIENDPEILKETGGIKGYGSFPKGSINVSNDFGQANIEIKIIGNSNDLELNVFLEKETGGVWKVTGMHK